MLRFSILLPVLAAALPASAGRLPTTAVPVAAVTPTIEPSRASRAPQAALPTGTYITTVVNGAGLPYSTRHATKAGNTHFLKLEDGTLRILPGRKFSATFRYAHEVTQKGRPFRAPPTVDDVVRGRYTISGSTVTFIPETKSKQGRVDPIVSTLSGAEIRIERTMDIGGNPFRLRMTMKRDPRFL